MTGLVLLGILPWVGLGVLMAFGIREPRPLPPAAEWTGEGIEVSIIVPARNERENIARLLHSLVEIRGVGAEVIVVDDRSTDGTGEIARAIAERGGAVPIRVLDGEPLPEGWFGKPWACRQGAAVAAGRLLLFTDADTVHHPDLLLRCLAAMEEDGAQLLSLLGKQEMGTVGERLVQPQIFTLIGLRYRGLDRPVEVDRWTDAIANGQFILVHRDAYDAIGGHEVVKGEVVEDLRLAQELVRAGHRMVMRQGEDVFRTRMYQSLGELVNGWTKNVAVGTRQAAPRWGGWAVGGIALFLGVAWLLPAVGVLVGGARVGLGMATLGDPLLSWGAITWTFGLFIWSGAYHRFGVPAAYALLYPAGAAIALFIVVRSGWRGTARIEWKGRRYDEGRAREAG